MRRNSINQQGKRDRNKEEKRRAIINAARNAFVDGGFENATMTAIANAAGVAKGTVFLYASSKEELLVLVFIEDLQPVIEASMAARPDVPFADRIRDHYDAIVRKNCENTQLARPFLKELAWLDDTKITDFSARWIEGIGEMVRTGQRRGEIAADSSPEALSMHFLDLLLGPMRRWLAGRITLEDLQRQISINLGIALKGIAPSHS